MPNWVDIKFKVKGTREQLAQFKEDVKSLPEVPEDRRWIFDFNRFIPMPESLHVEASTVAEWAYLVFYGRPEEALKSRANEANATTIEQLREQFALKHPKARELADIYHFNNENYGCFTWYEWANANWGTKWNACDVSIADRDDGLEVFFQTAWSFPERILTLMVSQFPELEFMGTADEEGGYFYLDFTGNGGAFEMTTFEGTREGGPYDYSEEEDE
jgi:hypothetical protein